MDINQANDNELQKAIDDITKTNNNPADVAPDANDLEAQIQSQMGMPPVPPAAPQATTAPVMPDATAVPTVPVDTPELGVVQDVAQQDAPQQNVAQDTAPQTAEFPNMAAVVPEAPVAEPMPPIPETTANEEAPTIEPIDPVAAETPAPVEEPVAPVAEAEPAEKPEDINSVKGAIARDLYKEIGDSDFEDLTKDWTAKKRFELVRKMMEETGDTSMVIKGYDAAKEIEDEKDRTEALLYLFENA